MLESRNHSGLLVILLACLLVLFTDLNHASRPIPFREAEPKAALVVLVQANEEGGAVLLHVLEVIRGASDPRSILVAADIWEAVTLPKLNDLEGVTYLVLLRETYELSCGHHNGLPLLSGGCIGVLPIVGGMVPASHASHYDGSSEEPISFAKIKSAIRSSIADE